MGRPRLRAVADRGYYSAPQIKECADAGIAVMLPKPTTSSAKAHGRFDRADFIYIAWDDEYQCPAGERAIYRYTREEHGVPNFPTVRDAGRRALIALDIESDMSREIDSLTFQ